MFESYDNTPPFMLSGFFLCSSPGTGSSILSALQDLPTALWPCGSKMEKHLQVFSVLQWVISFLVMGECVCVCARCCVLLSKALETPETRQC